MNTRLPIMGGITMLDRGREAEAEIEVDRAERNIKDKAEAGEKEESLSQKGSKMLLQHISNIIWRTEIFMSTWWESKSHHMSSKWSYFPTKIKWLRSKNKCSSISSNILEAMILVAKIKATNSKPHSRYPKQKKLKIATSSFHNSHILTMVKIESSFTTNCLQEH